jgi:hypothetical protein
LALVIRDHSIALAANRGQLQCHGQYGFSHFDFVAMPKCDFWDFSLGALLRSCAFFPTAVLDSVYPSPVQAAQVPDHCVGRVRFQNEMVPGGGRVVPRNLNVAVRCATENEQVMIIKHKPLAPQIPANYL